MGKILDASWHVDGIIVGSKGFFCNVAAMAMGFNKLSQHSLYDSWVSKENHKHFSDLWQQYLWASKTRLRSCCHSYGCLWKLSVVVVEKLQKI